MALRGFFNETLLRASAPAATIAECEKCALYRNGCRSPKMKVDGRGKRRVLIVGEAPAANEDRQGQPFVGSAGELLEGTLGRLGVNLREDCWITNSVICMPKGAGGKWRNPTDKEVAYCRPNVLNAIRELDPNVVLLLGKKALVSVISQFWRGSDALGGMERWRDWHIPCRKPNVWLCPAWHPSYLQRQEDERGGQNEVMTVLWERSLQRAFELDGKPWTEEQLQPRPVEAIINPDDAVPLIEQMTDIARPVAFDFETEGLKPENANLAILTCGMSDGRRSFAFPWHGNAVKACIAFLKSSTPKVGWNISYECRWAAVKLGVRVKNWRLDGILAAHVLDSRRGKICGLDFQEFVLLGMPDHKKWIKPYMDSKGSNLPNRLRRVDLRKLLEYNATDALIEWQADVRQAKKLRVSLV